jgi:hypothetical protein
VIDDPTRPLDLDQARNGTGSLDTSSKKLGPRMPGRNDVTISMIGPYGEAGMRLKIWKNYPHKLAVQIQTGDDEQASEALCQIVLEHNGWCDEDGNPLPELRPAPMSAKPGSDAFENAKAAFNAFWDLLPQELASAASTAIGIEVGKLAVAVRDKRRY